MVEFPEETLREYIGGILGKIPRGLLGEISGKTLEELPNLFLVGFLKEFQKNDAICFYSFL